MKTGHTRPPGEGAVTIRSPRSRQAPLQDLQRRAPAPATIATILAVIIFFDIAGALFHSGGHSASPAASIKTASRPSTTLPPLVAPTTPAVGSPSTSGASPSTTTSVAGAPPTSGAAKPGPSGRLYAVTQAVPLQNSPSQSGAALGTVPSGTMVGIQCKATGDAVNGPFGTDTWWDKISYGNNVGYVTDEYVDTKGDEADDTKVPRC